MLRERSFDVPLRYLGTFDGSPGVAVCVSVYGLDEPRLQFGLEIHDFETGKDLQEEVRASRIETRLQELFCTAAEQRLTELLLAGQSGRPKLHF